VIPGIGRARIDRATRAELARVLSLGPWCWPTEEPALGMTTGLLGHGPPAPIPGDALLAAIGDSGPSLWALQVRARTSPRDDTVVFGPRARRSWLDATIALPRSVPVLWDSMAHLGALPLHASRLTGLPRQGMTDTPELVLDGASFGLSFLLSIASCVFDRPLPTDLVASAAIDPTGRVEPVDGLEEKLRIVRERAPGIGRVLVSVAQGELAERDELRGLRLIRVRSAGEALQQVFGARLSELLIAAGASCEKRSELVQSFFRLTVAGRAAMVDWTPVHEAAKLALKHWGPLEADQTAALSFVRMVAARHEGRDARVSMPDTAWLSSLPAPVRIDVVAHFVQQSADTGSPAPEAARRLAEEHLVRGREAFSTHLRLCGALGRLLAFTGRLADGLELQREAAQGWWERMAPAESSYPLSEWFRLSGALRDPSAFEHADRFAARMASLDSSAGAADPYVRLARCRALIQLGREAESKEFLVALSSDSSLPEHLVFSAARWLARACEYRGDSTRAEATRLTLRASERDMPLSASRCRAALLSELDRAIALDDAESALSSLDTLRNREPGLLGNLTSNTSDSGLPLARWIADAYPY